MDDQRIASKGVSNPHKNEEAPSFIRVLITNVVGLVSVLGLALLIAFTWQGVETTENKNRNDVVEALDRATERLSILIRAAEMTAESAERAARSSQLTGDRLRSVLEQSLSAFEQRPELSYLGIVLPETGEYGNLERTESGEILLWLLPGKRTHDPIARNFLLSDSGFLSHQEEETDGYDPRTRPFYQAALSAPPGGTWMAAYQWIIHFADGESPLWGISYVKALLDPNGNLIGVLDSDLDLPALNAFLSSLAVEYHADFQIIERAQTPRLIGGSAVERSPLPLPDTLKDLVSSGDDVFIGRRAINGERRWLATQSMSMKGGIDWLIVASREAPFLEPDLRDLLYQVGLAGLAMTIGLALILAHMARRFGKPLAELERRVVEILRRDPLEPAHAQKRSVVDNFRETHLLGRAVDRMTVAVNHMLDAKEQEKASLALKGAIFDSASTAIFSLDHQLIIIEWNTAADRLFGLSRDLVVGKKVATSILAPDGPVNWKRVLKTKGNGSFAFLGKHGPFDAELRVAPLKRHNCQVHTIFINDVSERRQAEQRIRFHASHDGLTGLPNRYLMRDRIVHAITYTRRTKLQLALLYLDLDRFKVINDGYGHAFGDAVLKAVANDLSALVRESDTVSRQGGDEFLILLTGLHQADEAYVVAEKIINALDCPMNVQDREVHLSGSLGISVFPADGETADELIDNADLAMYRAKDAGRNTVQLFTNAMSEETQRRVDLENRLRSALAANHIHLVYQAKVSLKTGRITGCEALARWNDPEIGTVSPVTFIPIAEDSGLIVPLGQWVLREACAQAKAWLDAGLPPIRVAVNVSVRQFLQQDLFRLAMDTIHETGLQPSCLELELTESLIARDVEKVTSVIGQLRIAGIKLSIDDFGTGYSSLNYLKRFPIDTLKIDQSFVRDMLTDTEDAAIVMAVIAMAHNLGFNVLAEGVETEEHCRMLDQNGCDEIQGYYFSKPLPAEDFEAMMRRGQHL